MPVMAPSPHPPSARPCPPSPTCTQPAAQSSPQAPAFTMSPCPAPIRTASPTLAADPTIQGPSERTPTPRAAGAASPIHRQPSSMSLPASASSSISSGVYGYGSTGSSPTTTEITSTYASLADLLPNGASPEDRAHGRLSLKWVATTVSRLFESLGVARTHDQPVAGVVSSLQRDGRVSPLVDHGHLPRRYSTATLTPTRVSALPHLPVRAATYSRATGGAGAPGALANVFVHPAPPAVASHESEASPLLSAAAAPGNGDALRAGTSGFDNAMLVDIASIVAAREHLAAAAAAAADKEWDDSRTSGTLADSRTNGRRRRGGWARRAVRKCVVVVGMLAVAMIGLLVVTSLLVLLTSKIMRPTPAPLPLQPHCMSPDQSLEWPTELAIVTANLRHLRVVLAGGPAGTVHVERTRDLPQVKLVATCPDLPDTVPVAIRTAPARLDAEMQRAGSHVVVRLAGAAVVVNSTAAAAITGEAQPEDDGLAACAVIACARPHWTLHVPDLRDVSLAIDEDRSAGTPGLGNPAAGREPILFSTATTAASTSSASLHLLPNRSVIVHSFPTLAELAISTLGSISVRSPLERIQRVALRAGCDVTVAGIAPSAGNVQISAFQGSVRIDRMSLVSTDVEVPRPAVAGKRSVSLVAAMGNVHIEADLKGGSYGSPTSGVPMVAPAAGRVVDMRLRAPRGVVDVVPLTDAAAKALGVMAAVEQPVTEWKGWVSVDLAQVKAGRVGHIAEGGGRVVDTKVDVVAMHGKVEMWMA